MNWRVCRYSIFRAAVVLLVAVAWSGLGFCAEFRVDIFEAAKVGDLDGVKALLKNNPSSVSRKDKAGWTPLHAAASAGQKDMAEMLRQRDTQK